MICEVLTRWYKAAVDTGFVPPRINAIPAMLRQVYGVEAVESEWPADQLEGEPLIAEAGRDPVCPEECGKQMAPGIA